jgi:ubiquinone/menaquinone biosynthesis C-methylase UbiE
MIRAVQLFAFLGYCNDSVLEKKILECGAGVWDSSVEPLLVRFYKHGYVIHGIEISKERAAASRDYCEANDVKVDICQGDMRQLPFENKEMSFAFSYNTIFHMTKADVAIAMGEIERVLKPGGLCFVNFLSVESDSFGRGEEIGEGEFLEQEGGGKALHAYYKINEADRYFDRFDVVHKENRVTEWLIGKDKVVRGYIDYIARKK